MKGYLTTGKKEDCFGCHACAQACPNNAIIMQEDEEGFRYPVIDKNRCVDCGICKKVCPHEGNLDKYKEQQIAYGGYNIDKEALRKSTSGGAFSAIVDIWCDSNYVVFGATAKKIEVYHSSIEDKRNIELLRKSKYLQSDMKMVYQEAKNYLNNGKKVLFSGTPCQIAALRKFLGKDYDNLFTVEVVCEGVPSPLFIRKYVQLMEKKSKSKVMQLDYRYKDGRRWDFEVMKIEYANGKGYKIDRWFNPFWSIWLKHYMSRPSCYECPFTTKERGADITLGDLWGVHLYCPELYGRNGGSSLVVGNTEKGRQMVKAIQSVMCGHEVELNTAIKYQACMRKTIEKNERRNEFMKDLTHLDYKELCKKYAAKPSISLLYSKYVWGNRQKVFCWNFRKKIDGILKR